MSLLSELHAYDLFVIVLFLAVNLVVGFWQRGRSQSFVEYAIGDKQFSTAVLTATIVATWMSGSIFFLSLENTYSHGLYYLLGGLGTPFALLFTGFLVGTRMSKFLNKVSVADILGSYYGANVQAISGVSSVMATVGYIAIQFGAMTKVMALFLNYHNTALTVVIGILVILYSTSGGVKSVTFTDVVQFFTFGSLIPLLALAVWNGMEAAPLQVTAVLERNPNFSFQHVVRWTPEFKHTLILLMYYIMPSLPTGLFQRMAMARNVRQVRQSFFWAAILCLLVELGIMWVALLLRAENPALESAQLVPYLVQEYTYPGLKGLLVVGLFALAMSTADSYLNACAVVITNDVLPRVVSSYKPSLFAAKLSTLMIGSLALLVAVRLQDLLKMLMISANFYEPIVVVPLLLTLFGFKTTRRVVLLAMSAGAVTVGILLLYTGDEYSFFYGMLANLVVMLGAHYGLGDPGGWGHNPVLKPISYGALEPSWTQRWRAFVHRWQPRTSLEQLTPQQESTYPIIGFYILSATYASLYLLHPAVQVAYPEAYDFIQYTVLTLVSILLMFMIWPQALKQRQVLAYAWPGSIFYALFLVSGTLAMLNGFALTHLFLCMFNIVMAMLFLPWWMVLGMTTASIFLNAIFFIFYMEGTFLVSWEDSSLHFRLLYGTLLLSSMLVALHKRQNAYAQLESYNKGLVLAHDATQNALLEGFKEKMGILRTLNRAGIGHLPGLAKMARKLHKQGEVILAPHPELLQIAETLEDQLVPMAITLDRIESRVMDYLRLQVQKIPLRPLVDEVQRVLQTQHLNDDVHIHLHTMHGVLICDPQRVVTLMVNAVTMLRPAVAPEQPIHIVLRNTKLSYALKSVRANYTRQVPALSILVTSQAELPNIEASYEAQMHKESLPVAAAPQQLLPITNQRIVRAHYGYVAQSEDTSHYVIPVNIRELRTADMDKAYMDIANDLVRADDQFPGAQAQEKELRTKVQERITGDLKQIETALEMIKWYHGAVRRKTGEPFYLHPLAAALIVLDYNQDEETILGALLHDTVEDTPMLIENIETAFSTEVMGIVAGVTHLESYRESFNKVKLSADENIMMLLGLSDERALYVKIADRMHNMRTIDGQGIGKQILIARETLHFYVPLADKLGWHMAAEELKRRCLEVLGTAEAA